ncbi:MAG TPA: RNA-splicing ligase RtcB, partial [Nanoarchaeota archaeon]|nr:RNA-splicing ligase RtcB [Nanoarchaeota archaeon]
MKEKLQKINDYEWLIPKTAREGMNVDAKIIANKKIIDMMEVEAIQQLTNVACMPGVIEPVLGLADMHFGYGLPMGAVSAFDYETGIISSGMCGFDINCLSGDSKILHEFGYRKEIKDFEKTFTDDRIKCLNPTSKVKDTRIKYFMKFPVNKKIYKLKTETGEEITASEEHPFFTKNGMKKLGELNEKDEVSIFPFEGVEYEEPTDEVILNKEAIANKNSVKELEKRKLLPLAYNSPKLPYIIKLMGFLLGDGCAYFSKGRGSVSAYSKNAEDLEAVKADMLECGYSASMSSRKRHHKIKTSYELVEFDFVENVVRCNVNSLYGLLEALGLPTENKVQKKFLLPEWLMKAPLWQKRLFLAAFFGAELSSPKTVTKHGYNFYGPVLSMNKAERFIENGKEFLLQINSLLKEFGIENSSIKERKEYEGKHGTTYRLRLQISSLNENLIKLWSKVGFEYNKERRFLANAAVQYLKTKNNIIIERESAIRKALALKQKGMRNVDIYKQLQSKYVNERFLERTLMELRIEPRIAFKFEKFNEFIAKNTEGLGKTGQVWSKMLSKEEIPFSKSVYDFNVEDEHHNFIANNFVVSNCGVNSIRTNLTIEEVKPKLKELTTTLFKNIPCGVGSKGKLRLTKEQLDEVLVKGCKWAVANSYGVKEDLKNTEENGCMEGADASKVSQLAKDRGKAQLGTLGAGNHFLEVEAVSDIYDAKTAKKWGITKQGQVCILLHCGSRGLGHQVATDYLEIHEKAAQKYGIKLPDRQLACAPFNSPEGQDYFKAMKGAVNYSFTNRLVMTQWIRESFEKVFGKTWQEMDMHTVYGLCHNVVKVEEHTINGKKQSVILHRKGATRAFPGVPVLIAGSMGTSSYMLVGTEKAMEKSFGSSVHGAGRVMSRHSAIHSMSGKDIKKQLEAKGECIECTHTDVLAEEADAAYKPIDEVIESVHMAGISTKV